jgi:DNA polymerase-3 subunit delta'
MGQSRAVSLLQRSLEVNTLAHAYLFVGPAHVGKMTLALNLAQAVNCEGDEPPCGECNPCQRIASAKHADVQIVSLSANGNSAEAKPRAEISIDQIRQVQHSASLPAFEGRCKVFIIDGAEFLSIEAANCLLKTLEEPVDRVYFLLLTTNERLLPATVVSRCQRVELFPLVITEVESALNRVWSVEPERARILARLSHGCLGWGVNALDERWFQQRVEYLEQWLGIIGTDIEERLAFAAQLAAQFSQTREMVQERLNLWLDWWRDLLLIKADCNDSIINIDRLTVLNRMANDYSLAQIKGYIDSIMATGDYLGRNASPQLVLEILMLDLPEIEGHVAKRTVA